MTTEERCADAIAREARRTAAAGAVFAVLWRGVRAVGRGRGWALGWRMRMCGW